MDKRIKEIIEKAPEGSPLKQLREARILAVNPDADMVTAGTFTVKSRVTDAEAVQNAIVVAFRDMIESRPPLTFGGAERSGQGGPLHPITTPVLGDSIGMPAVRTPASEFLGGVAIVLEKIEPAVSLDELESRLRDARAKSAFSDLALNQQQLVLLEGTEDAVRWRSGPSPRRRRRGRTRRSRLRRRSS